MAVIIGEKEEFIEEAKKVHGDNYDYSIIHSFTKVMIKCGTIFCQLLGLHVGRGAGCPNCREGRDSDIQILKREQLRLYTTISR